MSYQLFTPIEEVATDRLAQIFNAYLYQLGSAEAVTAPRESMQQAQDLLTAQEIDEAEAVAEMSSRLYSLQVLAQALPDLYQHLQAAHIELLWWTNEDKEDDDQNFLRYAASRRLEDAELFGYTDGADLSEDGKTIRLRDEPEALAPFQLARMLAPHFASDSLNGERIGSSGPAAYGYWSTLILNQTRFTLRDPTRSATADNLMTYQQPEAPSLDLPAATEPDARFSEEAQALYGTALVNQFEAVLIRCQEAAALYGSLAADDAAGFQRLHEVIEQLVEGTWDASNTA